jgi:hypothetical protein
LEKFWFLFSPFLNDRSSAQAVGHRHFITKARVRSRTSRVVDTGFRLRRKNFFEAPSPARADRLRMVTLDLEDWLAVAECLGRGLKVSICTGDW